MATFYQKIRLLQGLLTGDVACTGPFSITLDLTRRCNLRCLGCRFRSSQVNAPSSGDQTLKDISFNLIQKLCHELKTMNTSSMVLLGEGEPFLHPSLADIILVAKGVGLEDNIWYDEKRTRLATNRELLERILVISKSLGRTPYSHIEAREVFGI